MKILLVEDDELFTTVLTKSLVAHHFVVDVVKDGEAGWTYGSTFEYDLIVLDIMLPKLDGIHLCQRFRAEGYTTPILLLTAQNNSTAKVRGLDAGADDYVVKPFDGAELIARIRALLRRCSANPFPLLTWGDLLLNPSTCEVTYKGSPLILTTKEYDLLELLVRDSQHVFGTDEILDRLWSSEEFPAEATVRSHVRRLRYKLVTAGAPHDFITTLHGRGYYLKMPEPEALVPEATISKPTVSKPTVSKPTVSEATEQSKSLVLQQSDRPSPPQLQSHLQSHSQPHSQAHLQSEYLAFLNDTWATTRPQSLNQLEILLQAVEDLQTGSLDRPQQTEARHIAHRLAGTLGIFGLMQATHLAQRLEHLLSRDALLESQQAVLMESLAIALRQEIQGTVSIQMSHLPSKQSPLLLIVDQDTDFSRSLVKLATHCEICTAIVPTLAAAVDWLSRESADVVLIRISLTQPGLETICNATQIKATQIKATQIKATEIANSWESLQLLRSQNSDLPILVVSDRGEWRDRLEVVRQGGNLLLAESATPEQVFNAVAQLLSRPDSGTKVMIVDDDQTWLKTLPVLLEPWGFKVTTLADPQEFWTVLRTVNPDVLVLDVNMPQVNGFELCQVLRSDPDWQRLPVLFLSVLTDPKTQNQAFTLGADDYLCKPVVGIDLANRILNRLQRIRAWAS